MVEGRTNLVTQRVAKGLSCVHHAWDSEKIHIIILVKFKNNSDEL